MDCSPTLLCLPAPHGVRLAPYPRAARPTAPPRVPAVHELLPFAPMPMTPIYASRVRCPGPWTERLPATYVCDSASALRAPVSRPLSSPPARPPTAYTDIATYIPVFDAQVPTRRATTSTSWLRRTLTAIFSCCPITCISLCFLLPHSRLPRPLAMSIIHRTYAFARPPLRESSSFGLGKARVWMLAVIDYLEDAPMMMSD